MHLTRRSEFYEDEEFGCSNDGLGYSKRSFQSILEGIEIDEGHDVVEHINKRIKDIIIKTIVIAIPSIQQQIKGNNFADETFDYNYFAILGFDFILDEKFEPYLIEVNDKPSAQSSFTFDTQI